MKRSNVILRILAFVVALALIGILLSLANGFLGNPISASIARRAIEKYIAETYPHLDLEMGKVSYNFKDGNYHSRVTSPTSVDTHFNISYEGSGQIRDDYEIYVLGKYNTLARFEREYKELVEPVIAKIPNLGPLSAMVRVEKLEYEQSREDIQVDMPFSPDLPIDFVLSVTAEIDSEDVDYLASVIETIDRAVSQAGYHFHSYYLYSKTETLIISIGNVTKENIQEGNLAAQIQEAIDREAQAPTGKEKENVENYNQLMYASIRRIEQK